MAGVREVEPSGEARNRIGELVLSAREHALECKGGVENLKQLREVLLMVVDNPCGAASAQSPAQHLRWLSLLDIQKGHDKRPDAINHPL